MNGSDGRTLPMSQWQINGLDIAGALEIFGDEEIVCDILDVFVSETPALLDQIRNVSEEDLPDYMVIIHGIKGSCRGIMAEPLAVRAEKLEHAAKSGDFIYIKENNQGFITDMEAFLKNLSDRLALLPMA